MNRNINFSGIEYKEHDPLSVKSEEAQTLMAKMKRRLKRVIEGKISEEKQKYDETHDIGHVFKSDKPLAAQMIAKEQEQDRILDIFRGKN